MTDRLANRMAYWHRRYLVTNNPLDVWNAIREARGGFTGETIALPEWCLEYIEHCSIEILRLLSDDVDRTDEPHGYEVTLDDGETEWRAAPAKEQPEPVRMRKPPVHWSRKTLAIPAALGFTRPGKNQLKNADAQEYSHSAASRFLWLVKQDGKSADEAYEIMSAEKLWKTPNEIRDDQPAERRRLEKLVANGRRISFPGVKAAKPSGQVQTRRK